MPFSPKIRMLFIGIAVLIAGGFSFLVVKVSKNTNPQSSSYLASLIFGEVENREAGRENTVADGGANGEEEGENEGEFSNSGGEIYIDEDYGFSFNAKGLQVTPFAESESTQVVLINDPQEKREAQIFIAPFDEEGPLTRERILKDLPQAMVDNRKNIIFGSNIPALLFWGKDSSGEKTREVWFAYGGNLYQISTIAENDLWLGKLLESWSFD